MTTRLTPDEGPMTKTRATATLTRIPMKTLPPLLRKKFKAIKDLLVYSVPMRTRFRRVTSRDGILLHGKAGWGEAAPFWDYGPEESARWIDAAINEATVPIPFTRRKSVPVNVTVPVLSPEAAAARVEESHGCATAKVKVADPGSSLKEDCARVLSVTDFDGVNAPVLMISAQSGTGLDTLCETIAARVQMMEGELSDGALPNRERETEALQRAARHLTEAEKTLAAEMGTDFISIDLRAAYDALGEILGETVDTDLIDRIFSEFCIGK